MDPEVDYNGLAARLLEEEEKIIGRDTNITPVLILYEKRHYLGQLHPVGPQTKAVRVFLSEPIVKKLYDAIKRVNPNRRELTVSVGPISGLRPMLLSGNTLFPAESRTIVDVFNENKSGKPYKH